MRCRPTLSAAVLALVAGPAAAGTNTLSLSAVGAFRTGGADVHTTGYNGNLNLPGNGGTPAIAFGFTVPGDFAGGDLKVILLWDAPDASACNFFVAPKFVYRARSGRAQDGGSETAGLGALSASTPFDVGAGGGITFGAPEPAETNERVVFSITPTAGQFGGPFKPGDAVNFGLVRRDDSEGDTCAGTLYISGVTIQYRTP